MENNWNFYGRNRELIEIEKIISSGRWFFCAISGRRRIGKTTLIQRALERTPDISHFYFQVPDSDERGVVQAFQDALEDQGVRVQLAQRSAPFLIWRKLSLICATRALSLPLTSFNISTERLYYRSRHFYKPKSIN